MNHAPDMKLLLLIYSGTDPERVAALLDRQPVDGYTELPDARGAGQTGRRFGTRAWPGRAAVFFTVVGEDLVPTVAAAVQVEAEALPPGERLHLAVMPIEFTL